MHNDVLVEDKGETNLEVIKTLYSTIYAEDTTQPEGHTYRLIVLARKGEALSSLCSLGSLTVETRTKNEEVGTHLTFDHSGSVIAERKTARQVGTTVSVEKLFSTLPVRSKEFSRNAYAIMAKGVRFLCTNITSKNSKSVVLKTQGNNSVKENIIAVLGLNTFQCLEPLSINVSACCTVEGFLSKPGYGSGRNIGDRQFFYINGRPVDMPKVGKLLNEVYKGSNSKQYPIAIMNFIMPATSYDVNVTPDKRKVFMTDEGSLILSLRAEIEKVYSPHQCSYSINTMNYSKEVDISLQDDVEVEDSQGPSVMFKSFSPKYGQIVTDGSTEHEIDDVSAKDLKISNMDIDLGTEYDIDHFTSPGMPFSKTDDERSMFLNHCSQLKKSKYIKLNTTFIDEVPSSSDRKDTYCYSNLVQSPLQRFLPVYKRKHDNSCNMLSEMPLLRDGSNSRQIRKTGTENIPVSRTKFSESKDEVADADKSDHHEVYSASNKVKTFCSPQLKTCDRHSKKRSREVEDKEKTIEELGSERREEKIPGNILASLHTERPGYIYSQAKRGRPAPPKWG
ncbi:DNA mismatch repair protein PMS1 [Platanthera guangdongensis]|uniref:DNA mismatch repair protein PMS1 n=1 Tax=Platanthera guangdongensis TaxID=2320717 RepID=A0ABR2LUP2_9ASPA